MTIDSLKEIDATIPQKSILKYRKSLHQKTTNLSNDIDDISFWGIII